MKYKCDTCDLPTDNISRTSDYMSADFITKYGNKEYHCCDACKKAIDDEYEFENEQLLMDEIVCPACESKLSDSWDYEDMDGEVIGCTICGEPMELSIRRDVRYTTKRVHKSVTGSEAGR